MYNKFIELPQFATLFENQAPISAHMMTKLHCHNLRERLPLSTVPVDCTVRMKYLFKFNVMQRSTYLRPFLRLLYGIWECPS